ncbi:disulfide isomerase DsbC N-terminal domain-containing protein [Motilimonas eburnea]|uniref:disulfide isomerase DsbC N-terminal domain-containing protein n=1 Tax=Motilimonas eburnea TaxID=1737488 RepID=UPI001E618485|nr:disulfide isomerase DsbC N-terminal domain-containing protein [Motilimonas eburnea]MCE2571742.1 hypothetical protein [Motilimonas eburnea]
MSTRKLILATVMTFTLLPCYANEAQSDNAGGAVQSSEQQTGGIDTFEKPRSNILAIQALPIKDLNLVETEEGVYFATSNGRFIIKGQLTDTWNRKGITTPEQARSTYRVPLSSLVGTSKTQDNLATIHIGQGEKKGYIFLDPTEQYSQVMIKLVEQEAKYSFDVVLMPRKDPQSRQVAKQVWCAKDKRQALLKAADSDYQELEQKEDCGVKELYANIVASMLLQLQQVPVVVRNDGLRHLGVPEDMDAFLAVQ